MIEKLQFCEMCRKSVPNVQDLHFVEENSDRGFCSEDCILSFYRPFMKYFESEEIAIRSQTKKEEELYLELTSNSRYMDLTLSSPDEVWLFEAETSQQFYTHIKQIKFNSEDIYFILICSHVDGEPAFIYYKTATRFKPILNKYRRDRQVDSIKTPSAESGLREEQLEIASEILEQIESKKSQVIAKMLEHRKDADIPIEDFLKYDSYLEETMSSPDEVYELEDDEGDFVNTFIKSFRINETSFFYLVMAMQHDSNPEEVVLIPIVGFPSVDKELYAKFAVGKKINEVLKS